MYGLSGPVVFATLCNFALCDLAELIREVAIERFPLIEYQFVIVSGDYLQALHSHLLAQFFITRQDIEICCHLVAIASLEQKAIALMMD